MKANMQPIKRYNVVETRNNFADIVGEVYYGKEPVLFLRYDKPMAVLISPDQWERYQEYLRDRFFAAVDKIQELNADTDPDQVERDVTAIVEEVRQQRYERRQG